MREFGVRSLVGADLSDLREESVFKKTKTNYIFEVLYGLQYTIFIFSLLWEQVKYPLLVIQSEHMVQCFV